MCVGGYAWTFFGLHEIIFVFLADSRLALQGWIFKGSMQAEALRQRLITCPMKNVVDFT